MTDLKFEIATAPLLIRTFQTAVDDDIRLRPEYWMRWADYHIAYGPAYVVYFRSQIVGSGGLHLRRKGIANGWLVICRDLKLLPAGKFPSVESLDYLEYVVKSIRTMTSILCRRFEIMKIRTFSRKGFTGSQRLLKYLGYERLKREKNERYFYLYQEDAEKTRNGRRNK